MTTSILIETHDWPVVVEQTSSHSYSDDQRTSWGHQTTQDFVPSHSQRRFNVTDTTQVLVRELPVGATGLCQLEPAATLVDGKILVDAPVAVIEPGEGMTRYVGTKAINAKPMTRRAYNDLRGWELPVDENGDDAGYLVEYADGQRPNAIGFEGYVSWSPADVFERAYRAA